MNKTVSANLSGVVFNVDEAAYEKLLTYLNTIRGYFSNSEGCDEIMADIEARIAEMLQEKMGDGQVVSMQNVEDVIAVMGQPEDYLDEEMKEEASENASTSSTSNNKEKFYGKRRLYRDPESNVAGGVCSGIGYYFGFDPLWLRLAFVAVFLFAGTGLLLYIILWAIIPEAKTAAEKLEMKGEPVNASNIGKTIEEEIEKVKEGYNNFREKHKKGEGASNAVERFFEFLFTLVKHFAKAFGKLIGFVFFVGGIIALVSFTIAMVSGVTISDVDLPSGSLRGIVEFFSGGEDYFLLITGVLLVAGIPILGLIYGGIKLLFDVKDSPKAVGVIFLSLWLAGVVICGYIGLNIGSKYASEEYVEEVTLLPTANQDTLYLTAESGDFGHGRGRRSRNKHSKWGVHMTKGEMRIQDVDVNVIESESDSFEILVVKSSNGRTPKDATEHCNNIEYSYTVQDSSIVFPTYFKTTGKTKWRAQEVEVYVRVPQGKTVYFEKDLSRVIYDIKNVGNMHDRRMVEKYWRMEEEGLTCISCKDYLSEKEEQEDEEEELEEEEAEE